MSKITSKEAMEEFVNDFDNNSIEFMVAKYHKGRGNIRSFAGYYRRVLLTSGKEFVSLKVFIKDMPYERKVALFKEYSECTNKIEFFLKYKIKYESIRREWLEKKLISQNLLARYTKNKLVNYNRAEVLRVFKHELKMHSYMVARMRTIKWFAITYYQYITSTLKVSAYQIVVNILDEAGLHKSIKNRSGFNRFSGASKLMA